MSQTFQTIQLNSEQTAQDINRIQANISNAFNGQNGPFIGGNLLSSVSIGSSATQIAHKLGRTPQVWVICDQNTNKSVWRTKWDANFITLQAGSACVVSIWVN